MKLIYSDDVDEYPKEKTIENVWSAKVELSNGIIFDLGESRGKLTVRVSHRLIIEPAAANGINLHIKNW